jgi:hypothetical protein
MYDVQINLSAVANHFQMVHIWIFQVFFYAPSARIRLDSNRVQFTWAAFDLLHLLGKLRVEPVIDIVHKLIYLYHYCQGT